MSAPRSEHGLMGEGENGLEIESGPGKRDGSGFEGDGGEENGGGVGIELDQPGGEEYEWWDAAEERDREVQSPSYTPIENDNDEDGEDDRHPAVPRTPSPSYSLDFHYDSVDVTEGHDLSDDDDEPLPPLPDEVDGLDLADDPLRASREDIAAILGDDNPHLALELPPAFEEDPCIRHAYVRAFVQATFHGGTHASVQSTLEGFKTVLEAQQARRPGLPIKGLDNMARTLSTAERRLGLSTDGFITYFALCELCWAVHDLKTLDKLVSSRCHTPHCAGQIYLEKRLNAARVRRVPIKILSYVTPHRALQHLLLRPGKYEDFQKWRKPETDQPGRVPPLQQTGYEAFGDHDRPLKDVYDGWRWRAAQAGLERRRGGVWGMEDVSVLELDQRLVALPCGIQIQINLDWFQAVKNASHSTGALYFAVLNNPREVRYRCKETVLVMVMPGPDEPDQAQLNRILDVFVEDLLDLYQGFDFKVHGHEARETCHVGVHSDVSDLPAARKVAGLLAHNSKTFMCPHCTTPFFALVDPAAYDPSKFKSREEWRYIKYAFRSRDADPTLAAKIEDYRGVRYSPMYKLPGWMPARDSPAEFMHCVYLCLIKHSMRSTIHATGLLNALSPTHKPQERYSKFFASVIWPASCGRVPASVAQGSGSAKADQFRSGFTVAFIGLFDAWQVNGEIPDKDAPRAPADSNMGKDNTRVDKLLRARLRQNLYAQTSHPTAEQIRRVEKATPDRNLHRQYNAFLQFTVAIFILANRSITPNDIKRGCAAMSRAFQAWARMFVHLTPYFHLAMHFPLWFLAFGPCYAWWTYPFERNNGFLGRFNHNGHSGGELEATMMRGWWKSMFVHELIRHFEQMPDPSIEDKKSLEILKSCLQSEVKKQGGTLQSYLAQMSAGYDTEPVRLPKSSTEVDVRTLGKDFYIVILALLQDLWKHRVTVVAQSDISTPGVSFMGKVRSFSHAHVRGLRYGSAYTTRGQSAQYGYIDQRIPVRIEHILQASHKLSDDEQLVANFAIVRRLRQDLYLPEFPWDVWASDLGTATWYAQEYEGPELVLLEQFSGHLVIAPLTVHDMNTWITVPFDHVRPEEDADVPEQS